MNCARAALTMVAPLFCPSQYNALANTIQQSCTGIDAKLAIFAIDAERDRHNAIDGRPRRFRLLRRVCCRRQICRDESCGGSSSGGRKKFAASWILQVRLLLV